MSLQPTSLAGLYIVTPARMSDERGWFAEAWNLKLMERKNLSTKIDQVNFSTSAKKGTFRGFHYQTAPMGQTKTVFCVRGNVSDIAVDVRRGSKTYLQAFQVNLNPENGVGFYIPPGFAHGWLALEDDSQIVYFVDGEWSASHERGVRYNDPAVDLKFPGIEIVNKRDKSWPLIKRNG